MKLHWLKKLLEQTWASQCRWALSCQLDRNVSTEGLATALSLLSLKSNKISRALALRQWLNDRRTVPEGSCLFSADLDNKKSVSLKTIV